MGSKRNTLHQRWAGGFVWAKHARLLTKNTVLEHATRATSSAKVGTFFFAVFRLGLYAHLRLSPKEIPRWWRSHRCQQVKQQQRRSATAFVMMSASCKQTCSAAVPCAPDNGWVRYNVNMAQLRCNKVARIESHEASLNWQIPVLLNEKLVLNQLFWT